MQVELLQIRHAHCTFVKEVRNLIRVGRGELRDPTKLQFSDVPTEEQKGVYEVQIRLRHDLQSLELRKESEMRPLFCNFGVNFVLYAPT